MITHNATLIVTVTISRYVELGFGHPRLTQAVFDSCFCHFRLACNKTFHHHHYHQPHMYS